MKDRGYYFDFVEFQKNAEQSMTRARRASDTCMRWRPSWRTSLPKDWTRVTPDMRAVANDAGLAAKHGFTLYPENGFESVTLTCVNNGAKPGGRTVMWRSSRNWSKTGFPD